MEQVFEKYGDACLGCRICELVCSTRWSGEFRPSASAIKIVNTDLYREPQIVCCKNCPEPACVDSCPQGALVQGEHSILFDARLCTGCKICVDACPHGACFYDEPLDQVIICNGCNGDYLCKKYCPTTALEKIFPQRAGR